MTGKDWTARLVGIFVFVAITTTGGFAVYENAESVVEALAPPYSPLSVEEKFKRAELPCILPTGASSGCDVSAIERHPLAQDFDSTIQGMRDRLYAEELKNRSGRIQAPSATGLMIVDQ